MTTARTLPVWMKPDEADRWFRTDLESHDLDAVVGGAGIAGLTTALCLLREGRKVVVIDREGVGAGETLRTSAHLANALDDRFHRLARQHGEDGARLAAASHGALSSSTGTRRMRGRAGASSAEMKIHASRSTSSSNAVAITSSCTPAGQENAADAPIAAMVKKSSPETWKARRRSARRNASRREAGTLDWMARSGENAYVQYSHSMPMPTSSRITT